MCLFTEPEALPAVYIFCFQPVVSALLLRYNCLSGCTASALQDTFIPVIWILNIRINYWIVPLRGTGEDEEKKMSIGKKRLVIKAGTSTLTNELGETNLRALDRLACVLADLHNLGYEIILVSSGAIAVGTSRLNMKEKPSSMRLKQAAAAVGQCSLIFMYDKFFGDYNKTIAQILLNAEDIEEEEPPKAEAQPEKSSEASRSLDMAEAEEKARQWVREGLQRLVEEAAEKMEAAKAREDSADAALWALRRAAANLAIEAMS